MIVLAGDVGGTNARMALVEITDQAARVLQLTSYSSPSFSGLTPIVQLFLQQTGARPERACLGVPGAVVDGRCRTPNLAWQLDAGELAAGTGIRGFSLINDFAAVGHGIGLLEPADVVTLQQGERRELGQVAYVGAGTGFGVGFRVFDGSRWNVVASEGGHAAFAPTNDVEWGLSQWLRAQYGHASWERVVSGVGIANIYRYLVSTGAEESPAVRVAVATGDPGAVISRHGVPGGDPLCRRVMDIFVSCYGAAAGNYGVVGLATGGVFLAGGIAPRIVGLLQSETFLASFNGHDEFRAITSRLPLHAIIRTDVAVLGAAQAAFSAD